MNDINNVMTNNENEEWKNMIEPFQNSYMISNYGRIKNIKTGKIKIQQISSTGYPSAKFDTKINKKTYDIHRLVAKLFIGECPDGNIVNHKDGNKQNNKLSNLEYITYSENNIHAFIMGLNKRRTISVKVDINQIETVDIQNLSRYCMDKNGNVYNKTTKIKIVPDICDNGYIRYSHLVRDDNIPDKFYQHRLIATTFIPNPKTLPFVNHINGNKHDNRIENLEWCTASENMLHNAMIKNTTRKVQQLNVNDEVVKIFNSINDASKQTTINKTSIIHVCSGRRKVAGTYKWKYVDDINQITS